MLHTFLFVRFLFFACLLISSTWSLIPVGTEFTLRPISAGICDIIKLSTGIWLNSNNQPTTIDNQGNPTEDAYIIIFIESPITQDPENFIPTSIYGSYLLSFDGKADNLILGPGINATITNITFNPNLFRTTAIITLYPSISSTTTVGIAVGFFDTYRNETAPVNSGITNIHLYAPLCWNYNISTLSYNILPQLFHPSLLTSLLPFTQIRFMEWFNTNYNYSSSYNNNNLLPWESRTVYTDTLWTIPNYIRMNSISVPWETVLILYQELSLLKQQINSSIITPTTLWLNIPVAASDNYINEWLSLLLNGNIYTNNQGLPFHDGSTILYIEYGNELWLNGTEGGPGTNYMYNLQSAIDEVQNGNSNLNNDGDTNPQIWGQRLHLRRLYEISQIIHNIFMNYPTILPNQIRLLYGSFQKYANDINQTFLWFTNTYPTVSLSSFLYGVCINSYLISYFPSNTNLYEMYTAWFINSDNEVPLRTSVRNVLNMYNITGLVSYEGSPVGIAADGDNTTTSTIIEANRYGPIGDVFSYDIVNNWYHNTNVNGTAYNIYALSSKYGPPPIFQWGIVEDLSNLSTPKYIMVENLVYEN